jgi:hypothetical protein
LPRVDGTVLHPPHYTRLGDAVLFGDDRDGVPVWLYADGHVMTTPR